MKKTDIQLTLETGYDFSEGSSRRQYINGKRYHIVNGSLFVDNGNNVWDVIAEIIWTDDYIYNYDTSVDSMLETYPVMTDERYKLDVSILKYKKLIIDKLSLDLNLKVNDVIGIEGNYRIIQKLKLVTHPKWLYSNDDSHRTKGLGCNYYLVNKNMTKNKQDDPTYNYMFIEGYEVVGKYDEEKDIVVLNTTSL